MLTQSTLKKLLRYNKATGYFYTTSAGTKVTKKDSSGYLVYHVKSKQYRLHRLAFLYVEGYLPEKSVDHIDGDKANNKWNNLRHVGQACNMQNKEIHCTNSSGFNGVSWCTKTLKWRAYVTLNDRQISLGTHPDVISAALARVTFEDQCPEWSCNMLDVNRKKLIRLGFLSGFKPKVVEYIIINPLHEFFKENKGVTTEGLAKLANIPMHTMGNLRSGRKKLPSIKEALAIAEATNGEVPIDSWMY